MKLKTIILFVGLIIIGCTPNYDKIFNENRLEFKVKRKKFDQLVEFVKTSKLRPNEKVPIKEFSFDFQEIANELGIESIEVNNYRNCPENSIEFNIGKGWNINKLN